jgi:hypothetical protein
MTRSKTRLTAALAALPLLAAGCAAADASVARTQVTEDYLGPSVATAGEAVSASLVVHAPAGLRVDAVGVAVRDSHGRNLDFPGKEAATIGPAGLRYTSKPEAFAAGTYRVFGAYRIAGVWTDLPAGTLTVAPAPAAPPAPVPTTAAPTGSVTGPDGIPGTWHPVFDDEFNGTSLDLSKWQPGWLSNAATTPHVNGLEDQGYARANVSESGGDLHLTLNSLGAIVNTDESGKPFSYTHGVAEFRVWLPGTGSVVDDWPATWTDGTGTWPVTGEDDVMEGLSGGTGCHFQSVQDHGVSGNCSNTGPGWHTFASDWEPGSVTYYYDGRQVGRITTGTTDAPMYLIMDMTSGATIGGPRVPATMLVDYVRVWQK